MSKQSRSRSRRHRNSSNPPATPAATAKKGGPAGKGGKYDYHPKHTGTMALWIATPFGVLMPGQRPPHTYDTGADDRSLQVRARDRDYLDRFRELYCPELGESEHFPHHDYPWKAYVSPDHLARAVARMILDTDSEVFKPLTDGPKGLKDQAKAHALHACYSSWWSTHLHHGSDGTSSYDWKGTGTGGWKSGGWKPGRLPERCEQWGHWFVESEDHCLDCDVPKPAEWQDGQVIYPEGSSKGARKAGAPVFPSGITPDNLPAKTVSYGLGEPHEEQPAGEADPWEDDDLHMALVSAAEMDGFPGAYEELEPEVIDEDADEYDPASSGRCPECGLGNGVHRSVCTLRGAEIQRRFG